MSKYEPLARYLAGLEQDSVTHSFSEISAILGFDLAKSAYDYRPWWANRHDGKDAQNQGWQSVGWETKDVDMKRKFVTFYRVVKVYHALQDTLQIQPLTIEQAKRGLAAYFGVVPSAISITINA